MPSLSATEWKVLCFIIRKTIGWHKTCERLSYTHIIKGTGVKSTATISKALKKLTRRRYVLASPGGDWEMVTYWLNTSLEVEVDDDPIASENEASPALDFEAKLASENEVKATNLASFSEDIKETKKNKPQKTPTLRPIRAASAPEKGVGNGPKSRHSLPQAQQWANWKKSKGANIDPEAVAMARFKDGLADDEIDDFLALPRDGFDQPQSSPLQSPEQIGAARAGAPNVGMSYFEAEQIVSSIVECHRRDPFVIIDELDVSAEVRVSLVERFCSKESPELEVSDNARKAQEPAFERAAATA
jgi:phage replication O-like protein O